MTNFRSRKPSGLYRVNSPRLYVSAKVQCSERENLIVTTMDTLDPCSDGDINNDMNSLYVEIIKENRSYYKCTICGRKLSKKQILKTHLSCVHGECDYKSSFTLIFIKEGYHIRNYKRYMDDHSVLVTKSTKLDLNKRSATRSKTAISVCRFH